MFHRALLTAGVFAALQSRVAVSQPDSRSVPRLHHVGLNSVDPEKAIAWYLALWPSAARTTVAGYPAVKADMLLLFNKVDRPAPAAWRNDLHRAEPQSAFWHIGANINTTDIKERLNALGVFHLPLYTSPTDTSKTVWRSGLAPYAGTPNAAQVATALPAPPRDGGFSYVVAPDGVLFELTGGPTTRASLSHIHFYHEQPLCAANWYVEHLRMELPAARDSSGKESPRPPWNPCDVQLGEAGWPSLEPIGTIRQPQGTVRFSNGTMSWYPRQCVGSRCGREQKLVPSRGQVLDHVAFEVDDFDALFAQLQRDGVKILEMPHAFGDTRAFMIEDPDGLAIELVAARSTLSIPPRDARAFVDSLRTALSLPGLVVILARSEGKPEIIVTGVRKAGTADSIQVTDRMHLGSNGKAITATMIGALVEQGRLTFETTLAEAFPDLAAGMRAEYRGATVRQLLGHSAGIRPYTDLREFGSFVRPTADTEAQRRAFAARVLSEKPLFAPGTKHEYSNAGVALAGMVAERITGQTYEKLVDSLVFRPLGGRALFGNPGTDTAAQPLGHTRGRGNQARPVDPRDVEYTVPAVIVSAGDASVTLPDYGKFLQMHLRGLRGTDGVLKAATTRELHSAIPPVDSGTKYAAGWGFAITKDGFETHGHTGSGGAYIAIAAIQPARDFAVAILTNIGGDKDVLPEVAKLRPIVTERLTPR